MASVQSPRRPGGQEAGSTAPPTRILRVGIILGESLIEERMIRGRETVTIGQSSKNTFQIPLETLPKSWPLLSVENGRYVLRFSDGMDGRIGDPIRTLETLKQEGAQRSGDHWTFPLDERSRGKIVLDEMTTVLFQFVTAPPLQPRPRLPASVRGTFTDRIDPQLAIIMAISILLHFAVALYAYNRDRVVLSRTDQLHREFQVDQFEDRVIADTIELPTETTAEEGGGDEGGGEEDAPVPEKQPQQTADKGGGDDGGDSAAPDDASIRENIANTALIAAITGGSGQGSRYSEMDDTDQGAALDKAIEDAKGKNIGTRGDPGDRRTRGPNTGSIGTDKGTQVGGPGPGTKVGGKEEEAVSRVKIGGVDDLSLTDLDPGDVARLIRSRYLAGIKRCHSQILKQQPDAGGRVTIRFTVAPTGRVSSATVDGFDSSVDACIKAQAQRWRFGVPKDDGKPVSADFVIPLILKPGT